jgi:hypothetical protein
VPPPGAFLALGGRAVLPLNVVDAGLLRGVGLVLAAK